jgi:hypothetical protein
MPRRFYGLIVAFDRRCFAEAFSLVGTHAYDRGVRYRLLGARDLEWMD